MPARKAQAQARDAAERAFAIEPEMPEALCSLGMIESLLDWDLPTAVRRFRKALALNPHLTDARVFLAGSLCFLGQREQFEAEVQEGRRLEPRSAYFHALAGFGYFVLQEPEKAAETGQRALELEPYSGPALAMLGWTYHQDGRITEAVELLERSAELLRRSPIILMTLGAAYAQSGRAEEARALLLELRHRSSEAYVPPVSIGWLLVALGDIDEAMSWMEKAFDDCNPFVVWAAVWPGLDDLRTDARYVKLLDKAGFAYLLERMT